MCYFIIMVYETYNKFLYKNKRRKFKMPEEKEVRIYPKRIYTKDEVEALIQKAKEEERERIFKCLGKEIDNVVLDLLRKKLSREGK